MGTVRAASFNNSSCLAPTMATATPGQIVHTNGPTTITVVANASGQTILVQPTSIVDQTSSAHHIAIERGSNEKHSSRVKSEEESSNGEERASKATVENAHYITVPVQEAEPVQSENVTHQAYVQYMDGTQDQTIYTTNSQMAYPVYTVGDTATAMYTQPNGQYFHPNGSTPVAYSQVIRVTNGVSQANGQSAIINNGPYIIQQNIEPDHSIIAAAATSNGTSNITSQEVPYIVNAGNPNTSSNVTSNVSADPNPVGQDTTTGHITRISPITEQWLIENYETADGVSLPRSTLYCYYLHHCNENHLSPVNQATFGKLLRGVFQGLRTRRLGTRGNSKYHYYGIRLKPNSPLTSLVFNEDSENFCKANGTGGSQLQKKLKGCKGDSDAYNSDQSNSCSNDASPQSHNRNIFGDSAMTIPDFPEINISRESLPEDCTFDDVDTFRSIYREHCEMFLHAVENFEFSTIESLWKEFWRCQDSNEECEEEILSKARLYALSACSEVQEFVKVVDYQFYQNLVSFLVPDVLRPIPSNLTQLIRNFARSLDISLTNAMSGCPSGMIHVKMSAVTAFSQMVRRYTSLNHLAQAARAVLQNATQINQMLADLNRVDFHNVQEQASWVCQCNTELVKKLEEDFKSTLQNQRSLEEWAAWLKNVVNEALKPYEDKRTYIKAARQFLLKWSFYSSMVIRDLTLRSAASFGSFHLIRLLYDEYMFYVIENEIARVTGENPITIIGEILTPMSTYTGENLIEEPVQDNEDTNSNVKSQSEHSKGRRLTMETSEVPTMQTRKRTKLAAQQSNAR